MSGKENELKKTISLVHGFGLLQIKIYSYENRAKGKLREVLQGFSWLSYGLFSIRIHNLIIN